MSPLFFVSFVLFAQFVLVNIVIAVLMKHLRVTRKSKKQEAAKRAAKKRRAMNKSKNQEKRNVFYKPVRFIQRKWDTWKSCVSWNVSSFFLVFWSRQFNLLIFLNPLTPLLSLKNLKTLNKFKNFFLSLNGNRSLPATLRNSERCYLKAFLMLFLKDLCRFWWKSSGKELWYSD